MRALTSPPKGSQWAATRLGLLDAADCPADIIPMIDPKAMTLSLLDRRAPDATICPSEVARAIGPDWRAAMPAVHAAVDGLVADGLVRLSWKGHALPTRTGPYRIGRASD